MTLRTIDLSLTSGTWRSLLKKRCPCKQLVEYIDEHKLNLRLQSAYKVKHSTETALIYLQNDFLLALDDRKAVLVLSLDLSSAYSTR